MPPKRKPSKEDDVDEDQEYIDAQNAMLEHLCSMWQRWPLSNLSEDLLVSMLVGKSTPPEARQFWIENYREILTDMPPPGKCARVNKAMKALDETMLAMNEQCKELRARMLDVQEALSSK